MTGTWNLIDTPPRTDGGLPVWRSHAIISPLNTPVRSSNGRLLVTIGGAALIALAEDLEQELRAGRRKGYIAEFIDDQQLVTGQLALEAEQSLLVPVPYGGRWSRLLSPQPLRAANLAEQSQMGGCYPPSTTRRGHSLAGDAPRSPCTCSVLE